MRQTVNANDWNTNRRDHLTLTFYFLIKYIYLYKYVIKVFLNFEKIPVEYRYYTILDKLCFDLIINLSQLQK